MSDVLILSLLGKKKHLKGQNLERNVVTFYLIVSEVPEPTSKGRGLNPSKDSK